MRGRGGAPEERAIQTMQALVVLVLIALALLMVATFLLWRVADHTSKNTAKTGTTATSSQAPAALPPPSPAGSGRELAKELAGTNRGIRQLLATIEAADLGSLGPSLQQVTQNTAVLAQSVSSLQQLGGATSQLGTLGPTVANLQSGLGKLTDTIGPFGSRIGRTNKGLRVTAATLGSTNGGLTRLADLMSGVAGTLAQLRESVDQMKQSLDRTNACLGRPVLCQTNP